MSKKINFNAMTDSTIHKLSQFNQAFYKQDAITETYKQAIKAPTAERERIMQAREEAITAGTPVDTAINEHSTVTVDNAIRKATEEYHTARKELSNAMKACRDFLPTVPVTRTIKGKTKTADESPIYTAYKAYVESVGKGSTLDVYTAEIRSFLTTIGLDAENDSALRRFVKDFAPMTASPARGNKTARKDGLTICAKSAGVFTDLFILVFIAYCVKNKGVLTEDPKTHELTRTIFADTTAEDAVA